ESRNDGNPGLRERPISVASRAAWAPVIGIPWAVMGFIVGTLNAGFRDYWIPAAAIIGTVAGFAYSVATSPFDGWLAITMPIACLGGTFAGLIVGVPIRYVLGLIRGEHS